MLRFSPLGRFGFLLLRRIEAKALRQANKNVVPPFSFGLHCVFFLRAQGQKKNECSPFLRTAFAHLNVFCPLVFFRKVLLFQCHKTRPLCVTKQGTFRKKIRLEGSGKKIPAGLCFSFCLFKSSSFLFSVQIGQVARRRSAQARRLQCRRA